MKITEEKQRLLRNLPGVDSVLGKIKTEPYFQSIPRNVLVKSVRSVIDALRQSVLDDDPTVTADTLSDQSVFEKVLVQSQTAMKNNLCRVINATGVVVHTNLGRSLLAEEAMANIRLISGRYSNLEFDLKAGKRGSRYSAVEEILCELSGAQAAMVVNNNAGAVLLSLDTIARGKKVIVSRGELVEIGGAFRIPDVMTKSGCILKEVGTTNRTHIKDYVQAIDSDTALLLKVHTSNYSIVGFTKSVSLKELAKIGATYHILVMEDLGSGSFIDFSQYGMIKEPTIQESVSDGAAVTTFSGDKLLGGPQAGIILGNNDVISEIRKNPLTRALRIDKMTLAALESTLRLYREPEKAIAAIPTLRMLTCPIRDIEQKAGALADKLMQLNISGLTVMTLGLSSRVGGGALPLQELPSRCVGITMQGMSPNTIEKKLRSYDPPIIGRIENDTFIIDLRTVSDDEIPIIGTAIGQILRCA